MNEKQTTTRTVTKATGFAKGLFSVLLATGIIAFTYALFTTMFTRPDYNNCPYGSTCYTGYQNAVSLWQMGQTSFYVVVAIGLVVVSLVMSLAGIDMFPDSFLLASIGLLLVSGVVSWDVDYALYRLALVTVLLVIAGFAGYFRFVKFAPKRIETAPPGPPAQIPPDCVKRLDDVEQDVSALKRILVTTPHA